MAHQAHRYMAGGCIQVPYIPGPGPPAPSLSPGATEPPCFLREEEDAEEEMLVGHEPDDLGDLMQEMREGAAWAEGLAMESDLALCPSAGEAATAAAAGGPSGGDGGHAVVMGFGSSVPPHQPSAAAVQASAPPAQSAAAASSCGGGSGGRSSGGAPGFDSNLAALEAMSQRHVRESAAEQEAAVAGLQPALRALLMHPGAAGGGHRMIPVGFAPGSASRGAGGSRDGCAGDHSAVTCVGLPSGGLTCAASLAAVCPDASCPPVWPPPPPAPPGHFFGAPLPAPEGLGLQQQGQQGASPSPYYAMSIALAHPVPASPSPFQFYQTAPVGFAPPPPPEALSLQLQQQQQPPQGLDAAAMYAHLAQQRQSGQARPGMPNMPPMFMPGAGTPFLQMAMPQPNSSGSGNASDGTTLRLRSSFESDTGGSCAGAGSGGGQHPHASVPQQPQLCSAHALAAFDQAAFDQQPCAGAGAGFDWRMPGGGAGSGGMGKCDASSDSSDCEDHGEAEHVGHEPELSAQCVQVVPDAVCYGCPPPPLPLPGAPLSAFGAPQADLPPLPCYYDTPAAQTARLARHASLERYRLKKARRGFGKKIRYQARKVNADKRPRVKGRFVKAGEAADILAAAAAAAAATPAEAEAAPGPGAVAAAINTEA